VSAEHERVKDPLPTRPPRPHPQGISPFVCFFGSGQCAYCGAWLDDWDGGICDACR